MSRTLQAKIDLAALSHNVDIVKQCAPNAKILAMVKANAYGHSANLIAKNLETQVAAFGVASLEEALELRRAGIKKTIVIMYGFMVKDELEYITQEQLIPVVHNEFQLALLQEYKLLITIWLKFNTGMQRLGFPWQNAASVWAKLQTMPQVNVQVVLSHFSHAGSLNYPILEQQFAAFSEVYASAPQEYPRSFANSAAILAFPKSHFNWVRPGLMLYGVSPLDTPHSVAAQLRPVMQLECKIIAINNCKRGDIVGYEGVYKCETDMPVGVISLGYGDGYPFTKDTSVLVNGTLTKIIGRISMDMATIDLRHVPNYNIGTKVILWGKDLPVATVAKEAGLIPYDLLCGITGRVPRIFE